MIISAEKVNQGFPAIPAIVSPSIAITGKILLVGTPTFLKENIGIRDIMRIDIKMVQSSTILFAI